MALYLVIRSKVVCPDDVPSTPASAPAVELLTAVASAGAAVGAAGCDAGGASAGSSAAQTVSPAGINPSARLPVTVELSLLPFRLCESAWKSGQLSASGMTCHRA